MRNRKWIKSLMKNISRQFWAEVPRLRCCSRQLGFLLQCFLKVSGASNKGWKKQRRMLTDTEQCTCRLDKSSWVMKHVYSPTRNCVWICSTQVLTRDPDAGRSQLCWEITRLRILRDRPLPQNTEHSVRRICSYQCCHSYFKKVFWLVITDYSFK